MYLHDVIEKENLLKLNKSATLNNNSILTVELHSVATGDNKSIVIYTTKGRFAMKDIANILHNYLTLDLTQNKSLTNELLNNKDIFSKELDMQNQIKKIQTYIDANNVAEKDANLLASYSLNLDELTAALKQEGFIFPTLNIAEFNSINTKFGEITLVADSELISPNAQNEVKLYASNLYEARMPSVFFRICA